ncbi:uncharacterized protein LOC130387961 [Gadus chalcogrammus]|uniref:uncharacterized protein LOC130387961 n=1 Tax=Gadus chalcogrammus TaxID=1042646 RepID=UPI0024C47AA4|nr:uncharacterized protein LOC130387961 [Gadus chalcogrammus]
MCLPTMSSRENSWEFTVQRAAVWCLVFHIPTVWYFYELQETICTLKEENLHLQHRLENISWVIRDLKHLLLDHFKGFPRQKYGIDSGIFMLMYALYKVMEAPSDFTVTDMPALRKWWCIMLIENLGSHGKLFVHWTDASKALLRGEVPPVFKLKKRRQDDIHEGPIDNIVAGVACLASECRFAQGEMEDMEVFLNMAAEEDLRVNAMFLVRWVETHCQYYTE